MSSGLAGVKVAVVGGDDRELVLIQELINQGAKVSVVGFPQRRELSRARLVPTVEEAVLGAEAIVLPMPGTDAHGNVRAVYATEKLELTERIVRQIKPATPVIIGVARPFLKEWAQKYRLRLIEIAEMDDVAILNSIPSAEGAIQIAMEELPITIHDSRSLVLGFGRLGRTLARMLTGLGSHVAVAARKPADLARIFEMGFNPVPFSSLQDFVGDTDMIFNTAPALVVDEPLIQRMKADTLIVDLASQPGGTDFQAAERLGIKAILAPGLPGKVAPRTAGRILAQTIPRLILGALAEQEQDLAAQE